MTITTSDYALMAGASYISTRPDANKFPIPSGWLQKQHANPQDGSGFEAISFINGTTIANSTEIVISYAGTYGNGGSILTNPDKQADAFLGAGLWSDQLGQAAAYYLEIKALNPGATISFTGHSLGGGLASLMSVFFGETAYTFDQAPFRAALAQAQNLETYLLKQEAGIIDAITLNNLLAPLDRYITAADPNNLNQIAADTLAVRQTRVWDINVQGELLSTAPWNLLSKIGTPGNTTDIANSTSGVSADDLHAQALLSAFLQSDQTAATNAMTNVKETLSQITYKLTDLLGMIFDKNLFANETDTKNRNLLDHLVRHQAGVRDPVTGVTTIAADAMVTRFTKDLWKLAQDGGLTLNDGNGLGGTTYSNWNNISKALTAFAMQMYYEDTANATNASKELFTAVTGGVQFDMADVSSKFATAFQNNEKLNLKIPDAKFEQKLPRGVEKLRIQ